MGEVGGLIANRLFKSLYSVFNEGYSWSVFLLRQDEGKSWCLLRPAPNPMGIKKLMSIVLFKEH